ncbi:MAG: hypothetical protein AAGB02_07400 [Pseudomonadota bacterium]
MMEEIVKPPALTPLENITPGPIPSASELGLANDNCPNRQKGGRRRATVRLNSFLVTRGKTIGAPCLAL